MLLNHGTHTQFMLLQVDANLSDIDQLTVTMDILRNVQIGKLVNRMSKLQQAHPTFSECVRIAQKAR